MLDERGSELYWEGFADGPYPLRIIYRRQLPVGLERKIMGGTATDAHLNVFPIPASDLLINTNLKQNPGY